MTEEKLVPELRFPEFKGKWQEKKLKEAVKEIRAGATPSRKINKYWNGEIPWMNSGEIHKKKILDTEEYITQKGYKETSLSLIPEESVLMAIGGQGKTRGTVAINKIELTTNQSILSLILNKVVDSKFLYQNLDYNYNYIRYFSSGSGGRRSLTIGIVEDIKFNFPKLSEQKKIGGFFYKIDKKIELQKEKIEELENHKKGLMQKIFNQEVRFKDENGEDYPEWEEYKMSKFIKLQGGHAFKSNKYKDTGVPIIRISNVDSEINLDRDIVYYPKIDIDEKFILRNGDLLIAMSGATTGKTGIYKNENVAYLNQRVGKFESINDELYYSYLYQLVNSRIFKNRLSTRLVAGAQPNISSRDIESLDLEFPCYVEQKKIADFLSLADKKINLEKEHLENYKEYKKGLMQRMFI